MVKTASLFSQLLEQIPRTEFARIVKEHQGEVIPAAKNGEIEE